MTPEERKDIEQTVQELSEKVRKIEAQQSAVLEVPHVVDQLIGQVRVLHDIVVQGFDGRKKSITVKDEENGDITINKSTTFRNALYFCQIIIIPLTLGLIAAWAAIQAAKGH